MIGIDWVCPNFAGNLDGGFNKWWYPYIHFNGIFLSKQSSLGIPNAHAEALVMSLASLKPVAMKAWPCDMGRGEKCEKCHALAMHVVNLAGGFRTFHEALSALTTDEA